MNSFSLSRKTEKAFPEAVKAGGREYAIDANCRTVLRCLRVLEDEGLRPGEKAYLLMRWFFRGAAVPDAVRVFADFVLQGRDAEEGPPRMDFEQDADAIYASFLQAYGIDLTEIPRLHWYKFMALLGTLGEDTPLMRRIALRELDVSRLSGEERARAERAQRAVALEEKMSAGEKALRDELNRALAAGENPDRVLAKLGEGLEERKGGGARGAGRNPDI